MQRSAASHRWGTGAAGGGGVPTGRNREVEERQNDRDLRRRAVAAEGICADAVEMSMAWVKFSSCQCLTRNGSHPRFGHKIWVSAGCEVEFAYPLNFFCSSHRYARSGPFFSSKTTNVRLFYNLHKYAGSARDALGSNVHLNSETGIFSGLGSLATLSGTEEGEFSCFVRNKRGEQERAHITDGSRIGQRGTLIVISSGTSASWTTKLERIAKIGQDYRDQILV
jgi:hypothetical protein